MDSDAVSAACDVSYDDGQSDGTCDPERWGGGCGSLTERLC